MADRFATTLDCADTGFMTDGTLDELPLPVQTGASRTGGIDLNKPRIRAALAAALALAAAPDGFTVAEPRCQGPADQRARRLYQPARRLMTCASSAVSSSWTNPAGPAATTSRHAAARTIAALLTLRDHVIAPILAGVRSPRMGRKPTNLDRHRPRLRDPAHRHANPVPARRHRDPASSRIDNILSIRECKLLGAVRQHAPVRQAPEVCGRARTTAGVPEDTLARLDDMRGTIPRSAWLCG